MTGIGRNAYEPRMNADAERGAKSPGGTNENSPPFQRWVSDRNWNESRQGRQNPVLFSREFFRPSGAWGIWGRVNPAMTSLGYFRVALRDKHNRRRAEMSDELPKGWASPKGAVSSSPRLPQRGYLGFVRSRLVSTPTGLRHGSCVAWTQPRWGWNLVGRLTQGSSFLATLGWWPEARWATTTRGAAK